jgi:membrane carboxypeptidase/penicillin-binding protein
MTGGHGALPMFVTFMKDFMKDKPKEDFAKAPGMPEDMKELFRQRQRELAAERAQFAEEGEKETTEELTAPSTTTEPKLEQMTLPPPPKADEGPANPQPRVEPVNPHVDTPPPPATRPREADPTKKKGKKGGDEPG